MGDEYEIEPGDIVSVNFHNQRYTLFEKAEVLHRPTATGESWIFKDPDSSTICYVSEGCTITQLDSCEHGNPINDYCLSCGHEKTTPLSLKPETTKQAWTQKKGEETF